eukprot:TRINITY_DN8145_c0_g1_i1.p1 TRINITY_DN8145_c0_g1~~TRINITY_DN8145_c0_g1_i1.p1  ORF type:complete len:309 (-),score=70.88 TRINITY_DN8145_c0_g1_i1:61-987(-)
MLVQCIPRPDKFLRYNSNEHPIAVQLGGSDPERMAKAAGICAAYGYDEININCGCPSPKVKEGSFGAALMLNPPGVCAIVDAMAKTVGNVPVTVKCRLGVDDHDSFEELTKFVATVSSSGVKHFIIHARKAFLDGLNPKENRNVPLLKYDWVYELARTFPGLEFSLNGGLKSIEEMREVMGEEKKLAGCMIGRVAYDNPWIVGRIDREVYGDQGCDLSRKEIALKYSEFVDKEASTCNGILIKPLIFLFAGEKDSNKYRRFLAEGSREEKYKGNPKQLIEDAIEHFSQLNPSALNKTCLLYTSPSPRD